MHAVTANTSGRINIHTPSGSTPRNSALRSPSYKPDRCASQERPGFRQGMECLGRKPVLDSSTPPRPLGPTKQTVNDGDANQPEKLIERVPDARLVERCASILSLRLLFDHVLHDTVPCSVPLSVLRIRVTATNGREEPGRVHRENQAPDREARWLALL